MAVTNRRRDNIHRARCWLSGAGRTRYRVDKADVVRLARFGFSVSGFPGKCPLCPGIRESAAIQDAGKMNRLYAVEIHADEHRREGRPPAADESERRLRIRARIGARAGRQPRMHAPAIPPSTSRLLSARSANDMVAELVVAGNHQPAVVHALAHAINQSLGNFDKTVYYTQPVEAIPRTSGSHRPTCRGYSRGKVTMLLILGGNPVYDAPADLGFQGLKSAKVPFRVHLGLYQDETSALCQLAHSVSALTGMPGATRARTTERSASSH